MTPNFKLCPEWRGSTELNDTQNVFICISQVCMKIQSTFCKYNGICLSEISTNCMFVWKVNSITYASDSDISANCFYRALYVLLPHHS